MENIQNLTTKILLVDDEPDVEGMIKLKFRKQIRKGEYEFLFAENGEEALNKLNLHPDVDIVISDINMPKMDGLTLLNHLNRLDGLMKAIIVSAYGDMKNIRTAMNRGAYDFVTKPIDFEDLTITIEKTRHDILEIRKKNNHIEKTELSLQESLARNYAIVNTAHDSIMSLDKNFIIESVNPATEILFACSAKELLGKHFSELFVSQIEALNSSRFENEGKDSCLDGYEAEAIRKDNKVFPVDISLSKFNIHDDQYYTVILRDITLRKNAENLLKEYNTRLEKEVEERTIDLRKLNQEKNEILGVAAHDLKNPLSSIKMLAKFLCEDRTLSESEIIEFSNDILETSERMFDLIKNLLDVNAIEDGKIHIYPENYTLRDILSQSIKHYNDLASQKNIKLVNNIDMTANIHCDRTYFIQMLDNLISNAIKYSPYDKTVHLDHCQDDSNHYFSVKDEGPGISEEDQKKLFKKFSKLSARPTGGEHSTGLGLSIVKKLADLMGGNVHCESKLDEGAKFVLTMPIKTVVENQE